MILSANSRASAAQAVKVDHFCGGVETERPDRISVWAITSTTDEGHALATVLLTILITPPPTSSLYFTMAKAFMKLSSLEVRPAEKGQVASRMWCNEVDLL
jgi:hypothetical protein